MNTNPEVSLINHVLKTGDIYTPLAADVDKSFLLYKEEWQWITDYNKDYKQLPRPSLFFQQYPEVEQCATDGVMEFYIAELHRYKARRSLNDMLRQAAVNVNDQGPFQVIQQLNKELGKLGRSTKLVKDLDLVANKDERLESLRERLALRKSGRKILGVTTGISKLDNMYGGAQKSDFWVIAGNTGTLKSWLALFIAKNAWLAGHRVMYFSLEMSAEQVGYRFDTLLAGGEIRNSQLTHATEDLVFDRYKTWMDTTFSDKHPFIVVTNEDLDECNEHTVAAKVEQWQPELTIIDYHGLFDSSQGGTEVEKTKHLSKSFKRLAMRTGCPIIDITAVTQDKKDIGNRPAKLHELAWSKQLGYDSDLCLSLCKHENMLEVEAVKVRRSPEFKFYLQTDIDKGDIHELTSTPNIVRTEDEDQDIQNNW